MRPNCKGDRIFGAFIYIYTCGRKGRHENIAVVEARVTMTYKFAFLLYYTKPLDTDTTFGVGR